MKKITLLLLFVTSFGFSQVSTTQEEYNYITKGLKVASEAGLDLKRGYEFKQAYDFKDSSYDFTFFNVVRTESKKVCATFVLAVSKVWGNRYFVCIPLNNGELYSQYYDFLKGWDKEILLRYSSALSQFQMLNINYHNEIEKKS